MEFERTTALQHWSGGASRIKWSGIFSGWVVGLATQMMLTLLGLAIGAWSFDLRDSHPMGGIPIGTGIWTGVSMLISAFVGGYVAARMAGVSTRMDGLYHGATVWGVNWLVFAWLTTTALSFMIGGLFTTLGSALQTVGQGVGTAASKIAEKGDINVPVSLEDVRRQVQSVLGATGKEELQPGQIRKDADAATSKAKSGQPLDQVADSALSDLQQKLAVLDRDAAINVMMTKLGMSRTQAEQVVQSTIGVIGPIKQTVQNVKEQSVEMANTALKNMGAAAGWLFLIALLALGATLAGGALGVVKDPVIAMGGEESFRDVRRTGS